MTNNCPECGSPVEVWADRSNGVTVNFACDNAECPSGKPPWDTPRPSDYDVINHAFNGEQR